MKKSINLFIYSFLVIMSASCKHRVENSVVPTEWSAASDAEPVSSFKLEKSVNRILGVHAEALEQMNEHSGSWQLSGMVFEMAISLEGVLGLLMGEGESAVKVVWLKNSDQFNHQKFKHESKPATFTFQSKDNSASIEKSAQLITEMARSTGKVHDPQLLKSNLNFKFNQFVEIGKLLNLNELKESGWKLSELHQVFSVSAEGDVAPGITVGGLFEFEIRWKIQNEENDSFGFNQSFSKKKYSLNALLSGLVDDFQIIETETPPEFEEKGFELKGFCIGLGVNGESDFGIAVGSVSSVGKLVFERDEAKNNINTSSTDINLISNSAGPISFTAQSSSVFHRLSMVHRHVFRKGLRRALKMGRFFARRATKVETKKWYIKEIEPQFEVALNGNIGLVNLEGSAGLALEFERKEL